MSDVAGARLTDAERKAVEFSVCSDLTHTMSEGHDECERRMTAAREIVERIVADRIAALIQDRDDLTAALRAAEADADRLDGMVAAP